MSPTDAAILAWLTVGAFVSFFGLVVFSLGRVFERGTSSPETCMRKHRDEI